MSTLAEILVTSGVLGEEQCGKAEKVAAQSKCQFAEAVANADTRPQWKR